MSDDAQQTEKCDRMKKSGLQREVEPKKCAKGEKGGPTAFDLLRILK
jgi:hypothetical protein